MRHVVRALACLSAIGFGASSSAAELLIPVSAETQAKLLVKTNYELRDQLYFAKRYKLVEIDFGVFKGDETEFTISAFDDLQLSVKAKHMPPPRSDDQYEAWKGTLTKPTYEGLAWDMTGKPVALPPSEIYFHITSGPHQVPLELKRKIEAESETEKPNNDYFGGVAADASDAFGERAPINGFPEHAYAEVSLTTMMASVSMIDPGTNGFGKTIFIQPVGDDPRYHIIFEQDPDKVMQGTHSPTEENIRKSRAYAEFRENLRQEKAGASSD